MSDDRMHSTVARYPVVDGNLLVGGETLERLALRAGSTPFFAYDRDLITERVAHLRAELPAAIGLSYAMKANPMPAVVQHVAGLVDSIDVASGLELRTALDTPIGGRRVSFAGPGKSVGELMAAVAADVLIEIESETEADRLVAIGDDLGVRPRVAVRVNPDFRIKGSGMMMGGGPQQFGIDAEVVPQLLKRLSEADVDVEGFHVFAGSQNLSSDILCEAQRNIVDLAVRLATESQFPVRSLNLGGGFGIPYFERDRPLDLRPIGAHLEALVNGTVRTSLPEARLVIELGRYLVGEAGVYVTRVVDKKISRGETFLVVDGGMHHQLAASGNFGQVIRRNYPVVVANRMDTTETASQNVVGCLCTPLDLLAHRAALPVAEIGDLVAIFQAGAYGFTASPTAFLSHPLPAEMLV